MFKGDVRKNDTLYQFHMVQYKLCKKATLKTTQNSFSRPIIA